MMKPSAKSSKRSMARCSAADGCSWEEPKPPWESKVDSNARASAPQPHTWLSDSLSNPLDRQIGQNAPWSHGCINQSHTPYHFCGLFAESCLEAADTQLDGAFFRFDPSTRNESVRR